MSRRDEFRWYLLAVLFTGISSTVEERHLTAVLPATFVGDGERGRKQYPLLITSATSCDQDLRVRLYVRQCKNESMRPRAERRASGEGGI